MATVAERVSVLETKVDNFNEKLDDLKVEVKESHTDIKDQLKVMYDASCTQHAELATKIKDLEGFKMKWSYMVLGGLAVIGFVSGHFDKIEKFLK
jgi:SMC interacting uncharacterized protein involved in chromosome segregation